MQRLPHSRSQHRALRRDKETIANFFSGRESGGPILLTPNAYYSDQRYRTFPAPISKWHWAMPRSIWVNAPRLVDARTTGTSFSSPSSEKENFCWFKAVGASKAASTPRLNHSGAPS